MKHCFKSLYYAIQEFGLSCVSKHIFLSFNFFFLFQISISRYGNQAPADELNALYGDSRAKGFGHEVQNSYVNGNNGTV